ncbi:hypothetical protein DM02DRAFT_619070 [Periconia macrospinosa]|uniref:ZZ-type domain-containing protein n=1 Tax=Periconia macrospinosa TaxID=97972 RepID=A0A2V1D6R7_9PLEO|nr:hypothetical protein DM02DRAFT_619070 [Periconia macrospinosa]
MTSPNPNGQFAPSQYQQQVHYPTGKPQGQYPLQAHPFPQYMQPYYGTEPAASFIAELPAPLPAAPPTTTSEQQLNQDQLLAHKLQQLEVEEARRRSVSLTDRGPPQHSLHAPSQPNLRHSYHEQSHQHRLHSRSVSALTPSGSVPALRTRALSQNASVPLTPYGPNSFSRPIGLETSDLPEVVVAPLVDENSPQWEPELSQLPEVVVGPHVVNSNGEEVLSPTTHPTFHLPSTPDDTAAMAKYLEQHRQVPHPLQWNLPPPVATFHATSIRNPKSESWLDTPLSLQWRTNRISNKPPKSVPPAFEFTFKHKGGTFRDPQFSWTMTHTARAGKLQKGQKDQEWRYLLKMESDNKVRKSESLYPPKFPVEILTTYVHASNYDSLRFVGPGGRTYKWVSHAPVTAMHGARFDGLRHALFVSPDGTSDPLYGLLVADHAYWDGFLDPNETHAKTTCSGCQMRPLVGLRWKCRICVDDHNVCSTCHATNSSVKNTCIFSLVNLPDETLNIRSTNVDPALVVATLQILKDWKLHTLRWEKLQDPRGFEYSENLARKGDLGRIRHWRKTDFDKKGRMRLGGDGFSTVVKMREIDAMVPVLEETPASETAVAMEGDTPGRGSMAGDGDAGGDTTTSTTAGGGDGGGGGASTT